MKKHLTLIVSATLMLASCASVAEYSQSASSQRFQDGIYSRANTSVVSDAAQSKVAALVEKTRGTSLYIKHGAVDTLYIPENKAAQFKFNWADSTTTMTLVDENAYYGLYGWNSPLWYGSYYGGLYGGWYGYRPWGFGYYSPWSWYGWNSWYWDYPWGFSPFAWNSWYWDPWYWDPWISPYWGCGLYSPWYGGMYWNSWAYGPYPTHGHGGYWPHGGRDVAYTPRMNTTVGSNRRSNTSNGTGRSYYTESPTARRSASRTSSSSVTGHSTRSGSTGQSPVPGRRSSSYVRPATGRSAVNDSGTSVRAGGFDTGRTSYRGASSSQGYSGGSASYSGGSRSSYSGGGMSGSMGGGRSSGFSGGSSGGGGGHRR